ncbi:LacI family DNA-binding transcriptional regulator [Paenibacillus wynnii]|uniref:LacI family DNA-binding transcriptional regulator n=1 Tax=Paenibacillus wynnii TaxID=268407 RepID=UPI00278E0EE8|nr:LacI family DNA-binding transcriptional regulator [Paenibacillus wynnii]MDQ0195080.1 LacI family transcriptional regulator [Paenibacillus wynnii]
MTIRIKDVAKEAGVSTATVSHVINDTKFVSDEVKLKVEEAMKRLQYIPNMVARSLRSRKSNTIGLIVPIKANDNSNNFFISVANGIEDVLRKNGYHLLLSNSHEDPIEEIERIKMFNTQRIDGLIIAPTSGITRDNCSLFGNYPIVFFDRRPEGVTGDWILVDGMKSAYNGVSALIKKGHRKIGFIAGRMDIPTSKDRFNGYRKALEDYGIGFNEEYIRIGDLNRASGYEMTKELIGQEAITAVFVANNAMSLGAVKYLKENHYDIPGDIALIGFDDYEWTGIVHPPLSVIRQPSSEVGRKAAEIMLKRIKRSGSKCQGHLLEAELVVRGSF